MNDTKIISQELKQDISKLHDIANQYAPKKQKGEAYKLYCIIFAGLLDYELAMREKIKEILENE